MENRSIKFRQLLQNSKWHYWGFIDGNFIAPVISEAIEDAYKFSQQFTNLHDKNGKEVFEGDVLRYAGGRYPQSSASAWKNDYKGEAHYNVELGGWYIGTMQETLQKATLENYEVIGDIYSTPELLQKGTSMTFDEELRYKIGLWGSDKKAEQFQEILTLVSLQLQEDRNDVLQELKNLYEQCTFHRDEVHCTCLDFVINEMAKTYPQSLPAQKGESNV